MRWFVAAFATLALACSTVQAQTQTVPPDQPAWVKDLIEAITKQTDAITATRKVEAQRPVWTKDLIDAVNKQTDAVIAASKAAAQQSELRKSIEELRKAVAALKDRQVPLVVTWTKDTNQPWPEAKCTTTDKTAAGERNCTQDGKDLHEAAEKLCKKASGKFVGLGVTEGVSGISRLFTLKSVTCIWPS